MSGAVKSGLIFALVGVVAVIGFSFVPLAGPFLCGPLAAALVGTAAGYYGVRWSRWNAGIGQGVLAGALAGIGTLAGALLFWIVSFSLLQSNPQLQELMQEQLQRQDTQVNPSDLNAALAVSGPLAGLCFGLINLLISLALGALGGWLATRNRAQAVQPPMEPPPMAPPN